MNKTPSALYNKIYSYVGKIPYGKVATYKQIALMAKTGNNPRLVGYALNKLPENMGVPWHRVINSKGEISFALSRNGHDYLQKELLQKEGVVFNNRGRVDLSIYGWKYTAIRQK